MAARSSWNAYHVQPELWYGLIVSRLGERKKLQQEPFEELITFCQQMQDAAQQQRPWPSNDQTASVDPRLPQEVKGLREKNSQLNGQINHLKGENRALEDQLVQSMTQNANSISEINNLKRQLSEKQSRIHELTNRLAELASKHTQLITDYKNLNSHYIQLGNERKKLSDEYADVKTKLFKFESMLITPHKGVDADSPVNLTCASIEMKEELTIETASEAGDYVILEGPASETKKSYSNKPDSQEISNSGNILPKSPVIDRRLLTQPRNNRQEQLNTINLQSFSTPVSLQNQLNSLPKKIVIDKNLATYEVNAVKWLPENKLSPNLGLLTGNSDNQVRLFNFNSDKFKLFEEKRYIGADGPITSIDFKDQHIIASSEDRTCRLWTLDGKIRTTLSHEDKVLAVQFRSTSRFAVSGSYDKCIRLWDTSVQKNNCLRIIRTSSQCTDLSFCKQDCVVSAHLDRTIRFWDFESGLYSLLGEHHFDGVVTSANHSQDGMKLLVSVLDSSLFLLDRRMNEVIVKMEANGFKMASDRSRVALSPDSQFAAAGSSDGCCYIWSTINGRFLGKLGEPRNVLTSVNTCAWDSGGRHFISCDSSSKLNIWA